MDDQGILITGIFIFAVVVTYVVNRTGWSALSVRGVSGCITFIFVCTLLFMFGFDPDVDLNFKFNHAEWSIAYAFAITIPAWIVGIILVWIFPRREKEAPEASHET